MSTETAQLQHAPWPWVWNREAGHIAAADGSIVATSQVWCEPAENEWSMPTIKSRLFLEERNGPLVEQAPALLHALLETWRVLNAAGLINLSNGGQLGQTSWYVKACDAKELSERAIAHALRSPAP